MEDLAKKSHLRRFMHSENSKSLVTLSTGLKTQEFLLSTIPFGTSIVFSHSGHIIAVTTYSAIHLWDNQ